ncbi:hypothetical protein BN1723_015517 [Verticillium longisporum]|uniref:Uncharacterized protein n=1 Tax=Verticillium longisporum TaxID=100787 RepID=A0A0G4MZR1_VERLO|nr:hypothetical protein BN1723_015517 [Verticillium longisporum]
MTKMNCLFCRSVKSSTARPTLVRTTSPSSPTVSTKPSRSSSLRPATYSSRSAFRRAKMNRMIHKMIGVPTQLTEIMDAQAP